MALFTNYHQFRKSACPSCTNCRRVLDSTHQPEEEDGQQVTRFLTQLVENHQLHEVEPLLHLIIRFVIQLLPI